MAEMMRNGVAETAYLTWVQQSECFVIEGTIQGLYDNSNNKSYPLKVFLTEKADEMNECKAQIQADLSEAFRGKAADEANEFLEKTMMKMDFPNPLREI